MYELLSTANFHSCYGLQNNIFLQFDDGTVEVLPGIQGFCDGKCVYVCG